MIENLPFYLSLIVAIMLLTMLLNEIKAAYPMPMVLERQWLLNKTSQEAALNEDIVLKYLGNLDLLEEKLRVGVAVIEGKK
ncbi:MAG: hypothetical protein EOO07_03805 [Chitinophagaceae bacterium]|nr:MAG: hypothetical protein EOO07_03805 [Chitinophagaceae bacterium]